MNSTNNSTILRKKMMAKPEVIKHTTSKILGRKTMDFLYANCEFEFVRESPGE